MDIFNLYNLMSLEICNQWNHHPTYPYLQKYSPALLLFVINVVLCGKNT